MQELTRTEFKIYMLIVERAFDNKSLQDKLKMSCNTVKIHKTRIFDKMGVGSSLELLLQYHYREGNIR